MLERRIPRHQGGLQSVRQHGIPRILLPKCRAPDILCFVQFTLPRSLMRRILLALFFVFILSPLTYSAPGAFRCGTLFDFPSRQSLTHPPPLSIPSAPPTPSRPPPSP